jgi:excisionase family DNA binding protein
MQNNDPSMVARQDNGRDALLLNVRDATRMLSISRTMLYELMARGCIESVNIGRCRRVPVDSLRNFVEAQRHGNGSR